MIKGNGEKHVRGERMRERQKMLYGYRQKANSLIVVQQQRPHA